MSALRPLAFNEESLSQILYLIYVNDTPQPSQLHTKFSDDWTSARNTEVAIENLQTITDNFVKWCQPWKLQLNQTHSYKSTVYNFLFIWPGNSKRQREIYHNKKHKYQTKNLKCNETHKVKMLGPQGHPAGLLAPQSYFRPMKFI